MLYNTILLRYGEIFLKGKNRNIFERKLIENIKKITGIKKIENLRSRFVVDYFTNHKSLKLVFGLVSYSPALRVDRDIEKIKEKVLEILKMKKGTFKIETKRSDKTFPIKSPDMNTLVGIFVEENSNFKFSFEKPDHIIKIEINQEGAYLFLEIERCFGGLPVGVGGNVLLLVEDEISLLAGLLFMKRGCNVFPVCLGSEKDISLLQKFSPTKLELKAVKDFFEIEKYAKDKKIKVLVSRQNFNNLNNYKTELIVMKPLIAYDDKKIKKELKEFMLVSYDINHNYG
ncbi:MAG: THUMP domain-containing protein [Nanoarchaeota archaeon]|nr:hypothetical protein [Nanoarchaeota archaeon]MBU1631799.1 hypothetical protein [Nanoarchaeota archaeon]MBU1876591.1 hypothetical protein [Nanoarchaeota archaeon]